MSENETPQETSGEITILYFKLLYMQSIESVVHRRARSDGVMERWAMERWSDGPFHGVRYIFEGVWSGGILKLPRRQYQLRRQSRNSDTSRKYKFSDLGRSQQAHNKQALTQRCGAMKRSRSGAREARGKGGNVLRGVVVCSTGVTTNLKVCLLAKGFS